MPWVKNPTAMAQVTVEVQVLSLAPVQWVEGSSIATAAQHRSQLWLTSDPWPGNAICLKMAKKRKKGWMGIN